MNIRVRRQQGNFTLEATFQGAPCGVTALFGPSGAGKTTLANMVAGLVRPDAGRIEVNGRCFFDSDAGVNLPPEKRRVGYVFQDGRLFPHLSVRGNLLFGMRRVPAGDRFIAVDDAVGLLGIEHLLQRRPGGLSGGEKQRVALGRALLCSPALLIMDEPLASLDAARKAELLPFFRMVNERFRVPVLYVSHDAAEIRQLAHRVVHVEEGRVARCVEVSSGPCHKVRTLR